MDGLLIGAGKTAPKPSQKPTIGVQAQQTKAKKTAAAPIRTDDDFLAGLFGQMGVEAPKPGAVKQYRAQPSRRARTAGIEKYQGEGKKMGTKKEIQTRSAAAIRHIELMEQGVPVQFNEAKAVESLRYIKADYENTLVDIAAAEKRVQELKKLLKDKAIAYEKYTGELGPARPADLPEKLMANAVSQGMEMTGGKKQRRAK